MSKVLNLPCIFYLPDGLFLFLIFFFFSCFFFSSYKFFLLLILFCIFLSFLLLLFLFFLFSFIIFYLFIYCSFITCVLCYSLGALSMITISFVFPCAFVLTCYMKQTIRSINMSVSRYIIAQNGGMSIRRLHLSVASNKASIIAVGSQDT